MKAFYWLLLSLFFQTNFAVDFKTRLLSETELKRNSSQYILVDENNLDKIFKDSSKKQNSKILYQDAHFHLKKQGLELNLILDVNFNKENLKVLSKNWLIINSNVALYQNYLGFFINEKPNNKVKIKAFLPIFEKTNHWQITIPWMSTLTGEAKFTKDKDFLSMQVQLFNKSLLRSFTAKNKFSPFSNIQKIKINANLPINTRNTKVKDPIKPILKKSRKALVIAQSNHSYNISRKYLHYTFNSQVKISRNPINELKIHIPKQFKLNKIQVEPYTSFTLEKNRIKFHSSQRDKIRVIIKGTYPLTRNQGQKSQLESEGIHFNQLEEERGFLSFFTKDVVKIHEVQFEHPESINKIDASELPKIMTQNLKVPILYAFRFYKAKLQFQIKTETFDRYPLKETLISSFLGTTKINPDLSASHKWKFKLQKQEAGNFILPLPKGINLKSARLNGREIHTFINKKGQYSVDVPSSTIYKSEVGNFLNLNQQSKSLASLKLHNIEVQFLSKNTNKDHFKIEIPLSQETTNIHYNIINDSIKKPSLKTNFPMAHRKNQSDLNLFFELSDSYIHYLIPLLILFAAFIYFFESNLSYNTFFHPCHKTKRKLKLLSFFLLVFTVFCAYFSSSLQQNHPPSNQIIQPILHGHFVPTIHKKSIYSLPSENNFSHLYSPHGLESNFYIELDFKKSSFFKHPIFTLAFILVLSLIFLSLLQKSYLAASLFLCFAILLTALLQTHQVLSISHNLFFAPLFIFLFPLLKNLVKSKKIISSFILLSFLSNSSYTQTIDLYKYKTKSKILTFIKQSQYPKPFTKSTNNTSSIFYKSELHFKIIKKSLKLHINFYLKASSNKSETITIPRYSNHFIVESITSNNNETLSIQKINQNNIVILTPKNYYPIIQVQYLITNDFPKNVYFNLKAPSIAIQQLNFPKVKDYSFTTKSPVYKWAKTKKHRFNLAASKQINFQFIKEKKRANIVANPKAIKTQVLEPEKLQFLVNHTSLIEENFIQIKSKVHIIKKGAYQSEFLIHLPKNIKILNLSGTPKVSDWYVDDKKSILMIKYAQAQKDDLYVQLEMETSLKNKSTILNSFYNPKADQFENIFHFSANENLSFSILPSNELIASLKNATQIQSESNPVFHQLLHKNTNPKNQHFKIQAIPRQIVHSISAFVDSLRVYSFLQKDGWLFSRYAFTIRNNGQQFFNIKLPENEQLLTARINGDIVLAGKHNGEIVIPMRMELNNKKEIEAFLLEITSKQKVLENMNGQINIPNFSLASAQIFYELSLFEPLKFNLEQGVFVKGNFKKEPEFLKRPQVSAIKNPIQAPVDFSIFKTNKPIRLHRYFQKANEQSQSQGFHLSKIKDSKEIHYFLFFSTLLYILLLFQSPPKMLKFKVLLFHILLLLFLEYSLSFNSIYSIKMAVLFSIIWILSFYFTRNFKTTQKKEN
ncbi:MAG: hypothetical protein COB02_02955 [Candidatus Cloacimonadota bacterium]|nr:MAG: hypothetical protein COB02_02955 [Candidatus Cloacimonadota bacterium]